MPHEIAMGEYTEQLVVLPGDNGGARTDAGHGPEHFAYRRLGRDNRHRFARSHDLMDTHQHAAANHAAGMKFGEIFLVKPARFQQHHGKRIAQRQHHGRARSRREIQRTSFLFDVYIKKNMRVLRKR